MNKQNRNRLINTENRLVARQEGGLEGWVKEVQELRSTD